MSTEPVDSTVTNEELRKAELNWYDAHYGIKCDETMERFFTYCHSVEQSHVDDALTYENDKDIYKVSSATAFRVKALAGPDYKAIVSAYYAKHPYKK